MKRKKWIRNNKRGMEMVQVAILVAIVVCTVLGITIEITNFVIKTFESLNSGF